MPASDKQIAANRMNAQKSTGPRTEAGKAISRLNAFRHGFSAKIAPVPGEDQAEVDRQAAMWQAELNPEGSVVKGYFVNIAVRHARVLDRIHNAENARYAHKVRDGKRLKSEKRARQIERACDLFQTKPGIAVRRLRRTPEGVDVLINRWESFIQMLTGFPVPVWDHGSLALMDMLTKSGWGLLTNEVYEVPRKFYRMTDEIRMYARTQMDVARYHRTGKLEPDYRTEGEVAIDERWMVNNQAKIDSHCETILDVVHRHLADLRELKAQLDAEERDDAEQIGLEDAFDGSEIGKLVHRYKVDNERGLYRAVDAAKRPIPGRPAESEPVASEEVADSPPAAEVKDEATRPTRNEPKSAARSGPNRDELSPQDLRHLGHRQQKLGKKPSQRGR